MAVSNDRVFQMPVNYVIIIKETSSVSEDKIFNHKVTIITSDERNKLYKLQDFDKVVNYHIHGLK